MPDPHLLLGLLVWGGLLVGRTLRRWERAAHSRRLNDAIRDGTCQQYRTLRDGRNADRMPEQRYANGG